MVADLVNRHKIYLAVYSATLICPVMMGKRFAHFVVKLFGIGVSVDVLVCRSPLLMPRVYLPSHFIITRSLSEETKQKI